MPQNRETGARADRFGREMADRIARTLGTRLITKNSNEINYKGKRIVIKSAQKNVPQIGVSLKMLKRIKGIIAVLEEKEGKYTLYKITPQWYKLEMTPSKSKSPSACKVMMVSCKRIREECSIVGRYAASNF
jgi:hypothetical protein